MIGFIFIVPLKPESLKFFFSFIEKKREYSSILSGCQGCADFKQVYFKLMDSCFKL